MESEIKPVPETAADAKVKRRLRPLRLVRSITLGIILLATVGTVCFLLGQSRGGNRTEISAVVLKNQLTGVNELASVTYSYTDMAQFQNSNDFYGKKVPFTTKSFILTYDGMIRAGVDLEQADISLNGTSVTVQLPAAKILSHEIDENSVKVFDEKTSIFNPFTVEDFTAFQSKQKAKMEQKALEQGLLTQAQTKAGDCVRQLLSAALPETAKLTVHSSK